MIKRILGLLLAVCLCVGLLPTVALAADGDYEIKVCGQVVSATGNVTVSAITAGTVHYDAENHILTLNHATISSDYNVTPIAAKIPNDGTLTIKLVGENTITSGASNGIYIIGYDSSVSTRTLAFTGTDVSTDKLRIDFHKYKYNQSQDYRGINAWCDIIVRSGAAVTVTAGDATHFSYGIETYLAGNVTVEAGAYLASTGGTSTSQTAYNSAGSCGILTNDLTVNGTLETTGGTATAEKYRAYSYGLSAQNVVVGTGAQLTATAGNVTNENNDITESAGVKCTGDLTVNGELTATGGKAEGSNDSVNSYGVYCGGNLTVNGKLRGTGGAASNKRDGYGLANSVGVNLPNEQRTHTVNGTLTGIGGSATSTSGSATSIGVSAHYSSSMTVYGSLTGIAGVVEGFMIATVCGVTGESIIVSGEKAELNASCDVSGTGASATAKGEGSSSVSSGILMNQMLTIREGAHVTAAGGKAVVSDTGNVPGTTMSNGISGNDQARLLVEGAGTVLHATGNTGTESVGIQVTSADIRGGEVVCSGQKAGIWAEELNLGAQGQNVDFTASATGSDPWAALFLNKSNGDPGSLTLTHVQVAQPAESKIGDVYIEINGNPLNYQTILNAEDETAMEVHIVSDTADETPPDWLAPVLDALDPVAYDPVTYDDVQADDWFYDDVCYVSECGLMTGTGENLFSPHAPVTRGMVMTILARREGIRTDWEFPWYAAGVQWAKSVGISDGTNPEAPITREQLAAMLYRYAAYKGYDMSGLAELAFTDANSVSDYAAIGLRWAVGNGIMGGAAGVDAGKLLPQSTATRAQLAAMLHRFFG